MNYLHSLQRRGTERIKPDSLLRMHDRQLPRHSQHGPFASRIRQLRRRAPHQRNHARRIDDTTPLLPMLPHTQHCVLAPVPHPLDIDIVRQVPDFLWRIDGVGVGGVHYPSIIEDYVDATP